MARKIHIPQDVWLAASAALAGPNEDADYSAGALLGRIARAIATERQRCAQIADAHQCGACGMDGKIALAIRAGF